MKHAALLILLYLATALQTNAALQSVLEVWHPDFLMLALVAALVLAKSWPVVVWAAALGLTADCLSAGPLGTRMIAATVSAWFVLRVSSNREGMPLWSIALLSFAIVGWVNLTASLAEMALDGRTVDGWLFWTHLGSQATGSALAALLLTGGWRTVRLIVLHAGNPNVAGAANQWKMLTP